MLFFLSPCSSLLSSCSNLLDLLFLSSCTYKHHKSFSILKIKVGASMRSVFNYEHAVAECQCKNGLLECEMEREDSD